MSRKFQVKVVPSRWIEDNKRRLDCGPYVGGAVEMREQIANLTVRKNLLVELTGGLNGIINAGRISRIWVEDSDYGTAFLSSSDILQADISNLSYIANSVVKQNRQLLIKDKWTLITRSGSIGRMVYSRADMNGMACTEDVLRVIPDERAVLPGYLFAYLNSRYGVPLIVSGTYGSIITHLEPEHLADLPVPRLGAVEEQAHQLVQQAADLMVESCALYRKAADIINEVCGFPQKLSPSARELALSVASSTDILSRLDATFHNPIAQQAEKLVQEANAISLSNAGIRGLESNRLKQVFVEEGFGTPFITSGSIFQKNIEAERYFRSQLLGDDEDSYKIKEQDILIARSGQIGGIIGRGVWADSRLDRFAASPHIIRLRSTNKDFPPGYVFAFLCLTDVGYQLLTRTAAGSSIPFLPLNSVLQIGIPTKVHNDLRGEIHYMIVNAGALRGKSQELERKAIELVECAIEEGCQ
jgi:type I restriction enzyme S subunit